MKGRFLCACWRAAGSVVGLSMAAAQTMFTDAPYGEHASLRLTKATLRAQAQEPRNLWIYRTTSFSRFWKRDAKTCCASDGR